MLGLPLFGFWKAVARVLGIFRSLAMPEGRAKPSDSAAMRRIPRRASHEQNKVGIILVFACPMAHWRVWIHARIGQDREEHFAFTTVRLCKSKATPPWWEDRHNKITAF